MRSFRLMFVVLSLFIIFLTAPSGAAQSIDRAQLQAKIESLRNELKVCEKEFLSPTAEDRAHFADFLSAPETGLIRLMPRPHSETQAKLTMSGGGAYYSFTKLTHEYGFGSDISLENGSLSVGFAGADYGFLATLGDIPLESVTLD